MRGGAHKTDLKGAPGIIKGCGKGLGTLRGAILPHHLRNDQSKAWAGELGEATSEPHQDTQEVTSPGLG